MTKRKPQIHWTAAMCRDAVAMRLTGASCKAIARVVGASPKAVSMKLGRLGVRKP